MSKRERVEAALSGGDLDRVPVSAWRHFIPEEKTPETLAEASLNNFKKYDWDWLKVNPRATYYAEAFGNTYDYNAYAGVIPTPASVLIKISSDLSRVKAVSPAEGVFAEQLRLLGLIKEGIGGAPFVQTVFSPLSVLAFIAAESAKSHTAESFAQAQPDAIRRLIAENPESVHHFEDGGEPVGMALGKKRASHNLEPFAIMLGWLLGSRSDGTIRVHPRQ